jgi:hypothetical protein
MTARIDQSIEFRRTQSVGPAMVYVLPHRGEEFLKLGFSRDPLQRMQNLHRRYFDFFDIDRIILVETGRVVEARRIELRLKRAISEHRAPSPLDVRKDAGGSTEWFRGAYAVLREHAAAMEGEAFVVHWDARTWIESQLIRHRELIFEWSLEQFRVLEIAGELSPQGARIASTLRDALDAYYYFEIDLADIVPSDVARWYRSSRVE